MLLFSLSSDKIKLPFSEKKEAVESEKKRKEILKSPEKKKETEAPE